MGMGKSRFRATKKGEKMTRIAMLLGFSALAAILYRWGGTNKGTKWRDFGVPIAMLIAMYYMELWHWSLPICALLLFGSLTTYNKWVGKLLGLGTEDVFWPSWAMTGLLYGVSMLPYAYFTGLWLGFGLRCLTLAAFTCAWSESVSLDWVEEGGRGAGIIFTLPLMII